MIVWVIQWWGKTKLDSAEDWAGTVVIGARSRTLAEIHGKIVVERKGFKVEKLRSSAFDPVNSVTGILFQEDHYAPTWRPCDPHST